MSMSGAGQSREFIEQQQPLACFCGHIHEGQGIDRIGDTLIINPGPLRRGGYVWACIKEDQSRRTYGVCKNVYLEGQV